MKKKIIILLFTIASGILLSLPLLDIPTFEQENLEFYVLQTGVFTNYENAVEQQKKLTNAFIFQDSLGYRVLVGAAKRESDLQKIEKTLQENEIPYYKKTIRLEEENEMLEKYNLLLEKTTDEKSISLLNRKILEEMVE